MFPMGKPPQVAALLRPQAPGAQSPGQGIAALPPQGGAAALMSQRPGTPAAASPAPMAPRPGANPMKPVTPPKAFAKGGVVKRGDGIAKRGHTKGRMVGKKR